MTEWQTAAAVEIIDVLHHLLNGSFESPQGFCDRLRASEEHLRLILEPAASRELMLEVIGQHVIALQIAVLRLAKASGGDPAILQAAIMDQAIAQYQKVSPGELLEAGNQVLRSITALEPE